MGNFAGMVNLKFCSHSTGKSQIRKNANTQICKNANTVCDQLKTHLEQELLNTQENLQKDSKILFSMQSVSYTAFFNNSNKNANTVCAQLKTHLEQELLNTQENLENILKFLQIPKFSTESSEHVPLNCSSKEENYQSSCLPCLPSQALVKYQITLENSPLC